MIKCRRILVGLVLVSALLSACNNHEKNEAVTKEADSISANESTEEKMDQTEKNTEQDSIQKDDPYNEHTEKIVFDDGEIYCVEIYDYDSNPDGPGPFISFEHHTYDKQTKQELTLLDVTGMTADETAEEIRRLLKEEYPTIYKDLWGNKDALFGFYYDYYNSFDPEELDFLIKEDGQIEVHDDWGLDQATNPYGYNVYVTLHRNKQ
ncbi:MAG: hypothetical protein K6A23_12825 [Butyrivibrio sp.]|nr:hypothetical protein [Butyrivibrio sp.]